MIAHDIDKLTSSERVKDGLFKDLVGFGRAKDMTPEESLKACHLFKDLYKQPAIFDVSNSRATTDNIHISNHNKWNKSQSHEIQRLKSTHSYIEVTDAEVMEARMASSNSLSIGDAAQQILRVKMMEYWAENATEGAGRYAPFEMDDAAYCSLQKCTLYFFRVRNVL